MADSTLRDFPEEASNGPWPSLKPPPDDPLVVIWPQPTNMKEASIWRLRKGESLGLVSAILEGVVFGAILFALLYLPLLNFWLPDWHWIYLCGAIVALSLILSVNYTLRISLASVLIIGWGGIIFNKLPLAFWFGDWHWLYPIITLISIGLLFLLLSPQRVMLVVLVIAMIVACWFSWPFIITHLAILLVFCIGGALIRCIF